MPPLRMTTYPCPFRPMPKSRNRAHACSITALVGGCGRDNNESASSAFGLYHVATGDFSLLLHRLEPFVSRAGSHIPQYLNRREDSDQSGQFFRNTPILTHVNPKARRHSVKSARRGWQGRELTNGNWFKYGHRIPVWDSIDFRYDVRRTSRGADKVQICRFG